MCVSIFSDGFGAHTRWECCFRCCWSCVMGRAEFRQVQGQ